VPFLSVTDTWGGGWDSGGVPCRCMICLLIYGSNVSKNAGPIELHWVTCRYAMYLRTGMEDAEGDSGEERSGGLEFIAWPFGYVWFWKIVTAKNYEPTHARTFWHVRVDHIYLPHVFSVSFCVSLSFLPSYIALTRVILNSLCRRFPEEIYGQRKRCRIILVRRLSLYMLKLRIKSDILK